MSCQFKLFASIVDVDKLKTLLFTSDFISSSAVDGEDAWNWSEDEPVPDNWLDECSVSLSPSSELLVFARDRNLVILNGKWDSDSSSEGSIKYHISWSGDVTQDYTERITSVLCLPLAGQGKLTTSGGADWTPVAVGFTSGAIRFYTENGSLLLSEVLHEEPVKSLKCQVSIPSSPQTDELHVVHSSVVCCVHGFSLCNSLKAARNQLALVEAKCSNKLEFKPLVLTKWGLPEQEDVVDVAVLGSDSAHVFNHLATASLRGGYLATYRSFPPVVTSVLGTGSSPFLAWHGLVEGTSGPVLTDVAKAVASKLKSAIGSAVPGWLGVNKKAPVDKVKEKASSEPSETMACRFGLCDYIRKGQRIYLSPQKNLSAVCDSLGRVLLVDNVSGYALRMWKGYRDAECAFIPVDEGKAPGKSRQALYLAIYAPRKAVVEVWALQQGPKIITFAATKNGRLMYVSHSLMAAGIIYPNQTNSTQHPCVFLTTAGELKQVCVPFHAILSNKCDTGNRDVYLFDQLKRQLRRSYEYSETEVLPLCKEIKSYDFKYLSLTFAACSPRMTPHLMMSIIEQFQSTSSDDTEELESEARTAYRNLSENSRKLISFYSKGIECVEAPPEYSTVVPSSPTDDEQVLCMMLKLSSEEVQRLLLLISYSNETSKVSFSASDNRFSSYLSSFDYVKTPAGTLLGFNSNVTSEEKAIVGEALCQCVLYGGCSLEVWRDIALESSIDPKSLLHAAVAYWLKKPLGTNVRSEMTLYIRLLFLITSLVCMKDSLSWWDQVRLLIAESANSLNALTSTIISRAVYLRTEKQIMDERLLDEGDDGWEAISRETCLWSELLLQVEAVAVLQCAVSRKPKPKVEETSIPVLEYTKPDITLSNLLQKGPGLVAESLAKWVTSWGLEPEWILKLEGLEEELKTGDGTKAVRVDSSAEALPSTLKEDVVFQLLELIRKYFPHSATPLHILANVCWEYFSAWAKQPQETDFLSAGLRCLNLIPHQSLKLGLCAVIWSVHLKTYFENIIKLLQKIGKLPKDRLCQQHVNIPASGVNHSLQGLVEFYSIFIECASTPINLDTEKNDLFEKREAIWTGDYGKSLIDIAFAQGEPNLYILKTHGLCARALLFLAALPIRLYRPVTALLHPVEESMLWMDIRHTKVIPSPTPDAKIEENRLFYLLKVINYTTEAMCSQEITIEEATNWIGKCYSLAEDWNVPVDSIRIQHVVNLYKNNGDQLAAELVRSVNATMELGSELLVIVGQRMKKIILCSSNLGEMAHLSPALTNWIMEQEESKELSNVTDVLQLCSLVVNMLPTSSADHKFATLLLEGIQPLAA